MGTEDVELVDEEETGHDGELVTQEGAGYMPTVALLLRWISNPWTKGE